MELVYVGLVSGAVTILMNVISFAFGRQRARAEAKNLDSASSKLDSESVKIATESESVMALTIKTFQEIYQDLIRDMTVRISRLEEERTASGTRIDGLEKLVNEQNRLIASLREEIALLKKQLVSLGHVPDAVEE